MQRKRRDGHGAGKAEQTLRRTATSARSTRAGWVKVIAAALATVATVAPLGAARAGATTIDGVVDTSFGTSGRAIVQGPNGAPIQVYGSAITPDDKVIVVAAPANGDSIVYVARLDAAGRLDTSYGSGGWEVEQPASPMLPVAVAVDSDGAAYVAGIGGSAQVEQIAVVRVSPTGVLDHTYGTDGEEMVLTNAGDVPTSAALGPDGSLFIAGYTYTNPPSGVLVELDRHGQPDLSLAGSGRLVDDQHNTEQFLAVSVDASGRPVVAGQVYSAFLNRNIAGVWRFTTTGQFDTSFNGAGGNILFPAGNGTAGTGVRVQDDGSVVVTAANTLSNHITVPLVARFTKTGGLDASFGTNGTAQPQLGVQFDPYWAIVTADHRIIASGARADTHGGIVARLGTNGSLDTGFGNFGSNATADPAPWGHADIVGGRLLHVGMSTQGTPHAIDVEAFALAPQPVSAPAPAGLTVAHYGLAQEWISWQAPTEGPAVLGYRIHDDRLGTDTWADGTAITASVPHVPGTTETYTVTPWTATGFGPGASVSVAVPAEPRPLTIVAPHRLLDTRIGARPAAGAITAVSTGAPAGTLSVLVNLTATDATDGGYVTADRCSALQPGEQASSNLNFTAHQTVANNAVVPVDPDGRFCLYTSAPTHLIADLQGEYLSLVGSGSGMEIATANRVLDTRSSAKPAADSLTKVTTHLPAGSTAALVNLTVTRAEGGGYVTADRCSAMTTGLQSKSNLNFAAGQTVANGSVVPLDPDGSFCVYTSVATDVLVDVQGRYTASGTKWLDSVAPHRLLDSRGGTRPAAGTITPVSTGAAGAGAVLVNLTVTNAGAAGYVTAARCSELAPREQASSNVNFPAGANVANLAVVPVDPDGRFCLYTSARADLVADLQGVYTGG